jgi:molybdenum cofactor biosynthesis enzyme MoaA
VKVVAGTSSHTDPTSGPFRCTVDDLYLAIAFIKECNFRCGYCHPFGESKITHGQNMSAAELRAVIDASYDVGFRTYRFTGGECTLVPWFAATLEHAAELPSTRINVCTNGSTLERHTELFTRYKNRVSVRVSLDAASAEAYGSIEKVLTVQLFEALRALVGRGVHIRFNTVVTRENVHEIPALLELATSLGVDIKLLDLYVQDEYLATQGGAVAQHYWRDNFVDLRTLVPMLSRRAHEPERRYVGDGGFGIPMYAFRIGGITVILKDSTRGAHFSSRRCINQCPAFGTRCQEGVYTPHVSSNMVLHINGCTNDRWRWPLRGKSRAEQQAAFQDVVETFFQDLVYVPTPPMTIQTRELVQLGRRRH